MTHDSMVAIIHNAFRSYLSISANDVSMFEKELNAFRGSPAGLGSRCRVPYSTTTDNNNSNRLMHPGALTMDPENAFSWVPST